MAAGGALGGGGGALGGGGGALGGGAFVGDPNHSPPWVRAEGAVLLVLRSADKVFVARAPDGSGGVRTLAADRGLLGVLARRAERVSIRDANADARLDVRTRIDIAAALALRSGPIDAPPSARLRSLLLQPLLSASGALLGIIALANRVVEGAAQPIPKPDEIGAFTHVRATRSCAVVRARRAAPGVPVTRWRAHAHVRAPARTRPSPRARRLTRRSPQRSRRS